MRGAAIELANQVNQMSNGQSWDGLIASDMMNLAEFIALARPMFDTCPSVLYLHENQFSYPLHPDERVDYHYILTNFISVLAASKVVFNSEYNRNDFFQGIQYVFNKMPDYVPDKQSLKKLKEECLVLPPCVELPQHSSVKKSKNKVPVLLWNHRWDRDKQPEVFLSAMEELVTRDVEFQVIICGESFDSGENCFQSAPATLGDRLIHCGYAESRAQYQEYLDMSDIVISTSMQEFFGISIVEAVHAGAFPLVPKRLNYPYLIPKQFHALALYQDHDFVEQLQTLIGLSASDQLPELSHPMEQYKWDCHLGQYDDLFEG